MKAVAILLLSAIAMSSAQGVNVVDNPGAGQVNIVEQPGDAAKTVGAPVQFQDVDPAFGRPSAGDGSDVVVDNPDPSFYLGGDSSAVDSSTGSGDNIVVAQPDPAFYLGGATSGTEGNSDTVQNPDPAFYLPSSNNNGNVAPSIDPTFVVDAAFYRPSDPQAGPLRPNYRPPKYPNPAARAGQ